MTTDIRITLSTILSQILKRNICAQDLRSDLNLFTELGLDSISVMDFLIEIENTLGILVDENALSASLFERFGNLEEFLSTKLLAVG